MSDLIAAAQQALEAFEDHAKQYPHMQKGYTLDAITALRAALEQPEQEPVALWHRSGDGYAPVTLEQSHPPEPLTLDEALAQGWRRFYAHPPRREWLDELHSMVEVLEREILK